MTSPDYTTQRIWSDSHQANINHILDYKIPSSFFSKPRLATMYEDTRNATDFVCVSLGDKTFGQRVRSWKYTTYYPWDITIRSKTNGRKSELDKILAGHMDYMFYGFSYNNEIARWFIVDMNMFRSCWPIAQQGGTVNETIDGPKGLITRVCRLKYEINENTKEDGTKDGTGLLGVNLLTWPSSMLVHSNVRRHFMARITSDDDE